MVKYKLQSKNKTFTLVLLIGKRIANRYCSYILVHIGM